MKSAKTQSKKMRLNLKPPFRKHLLGSTSELVVTCAADVKAEKLRWIWPKRISRGNVSIIAGEPGLGKSQLVANLAATVSTGGEWPCEEGTAVAGDVVMIVAEDRTADTVRPRLEAAGADLRRVHFIEMVNDKETGRRRFSLLADLMRLDRALSNLKKPRLVTIDPLNAFLASVNGEKFNANDITQVRALLSRLDDLAKKYRVAIICVTHPTKTSSGSALARIMGSSALVAAARAVFGIAMDIAAPTSVGTSNEDRCRIRLFIE